MPVTVLSPSVEQRMRAYHELSNRVRSLEPRARLKPTVTLSRAGSSAARRSRWRRS